MVADMEGGVMEYIKTINARILKISRSSFIHGVVVFLPQACLGVRAKALPHTKLP